MKTKNTARCRILEAVHETARDLHQAGLIDKRRMREYDALCLAPVPECDTVRRARTMSREDPWQEE